MIKIWDKFFFSYTSLSNFFKNVNNNAHLIFFKWSILKKDHLGDWSCLCFRQKELALGKKIILTFPLKFRIWKRTSTGPTEVHRFLMTRSDVDTERFFTITLLVLEVTTILWNQRTFNIIKQFLYYMYSYCSLYNPNVPLNKPESLMLIKSSLN